MKRLSVFFFLLPLLANGDGNDWVDPSYVLQAAKIPDPKTGSARSKIISYAGASAKNGPWTVSSGTSVQPPNGDPRDYLSWAPYHWPNCNWCAGPRTHLSTGSNVTRNGTESQIEPNDTSQCNNDGSCTASQGGDAYDGNYDDGDEVGEGEVHANGDSDNASGDQGGDEGPLSSVLPAPVHLSHSKMVTKVKRYWTPRSIDNLRSSIISEKSRMPEHSLPTTSLFDITVAPSSSSDDSDVMTGPPGVAEDAGKTSKPAPKSSSTKGGGNAKPSPSKASPDSSKCTPSPTKSLAPSATWTLCPYVVRDGKLNPDVRMLNGVNAIADVTQSVLYNALAAILIPTSGDAKAYAKNAASFIQTFFLDPKVGMNPEIQFGQLIRGPGEQVGQYLGILDFRGMVKVSNAVQLMRDANIPDWTSNMDSQMVAWSTKYVKWLSTSDLGHQAGSSPNNHGSFYANQVAAMNVLVGDTNAARAALQDYFQNQFKDQIAASGEQPFEAVRTRPFHYRCFNLEAMITNAKIGDYLGLDFWTAKSKYGATIQTALDYTMGLNPGDEDIVDIFPHVEAIASAYGDPSGKYARFLAKNFPSYASATYYFYDQPGALDRAPASSPKASKILSNTTQNYEVLVENNATVAKPSQPDTPKENSDLEADAMPTATIAFECPAAFATGTEVQLDDGVFVTCDELKPFYGYIEGST